MTRPYYYRGGGQGQRPAYTYFGGGGMTPAIRMIMIICAVVYVLQGLGGINTPRLGLTPADVVGRLAVWQLVTYIFLHGGFFHILFNMFALWMFGTDLEHRWGTREFVKFFLVCGIGAGIVNVIVTPSSPIPIVGASGAIYGILMAYGMLYPNRTLLLFPFLIPIKVKYYVMFIGGMALLSSLSSGGGGGIAHVAHLGGMIFGYFYLRYVGGARRLKIAGGFRERYEQWKRARLRRKFEDYYNRRQAERERDNDPGRWN